LILHLGMLVLQVALILAVCRAVGSIFSFFRQPRVVGEMFAGILLGPSFLGWLMPQFSAFMFPLHGLSYLHLLSQAGLIIFMFLVGLGINLEELRENGHAAILTSHASITVPFLLASMLSLYLYPRLSDDSVSFTSFGLFMGASMSITAFPVLARILAERNMLQSRLGTVAITSAAVDDVTGWCILAYIVALFNVAHASTWRLTLAGIAVFVLILVFVVQRFLRRFEAIYRQRGTLSKSLLALMLLLVLAAALCTNWLGIHLLFGAFLMGAIMPKEKQFVRYIFQRFEAVTVVVLLPLFFAFTGLRTSIGLVKGPEAWFYCIVIIVIATAGKLGGSLAASVLMGMPLREAVGLGTLMNTRGLMELVILNIGLDIKIITPTLFSMMVLMALVTTFMTTPVLDMICPNPLIRTASHQSSNKAGDEHRALA
jgi:K+:H+ antiporter